MKEDGTHAALPAPSALCERLCSCLSRAHRTCRWGGWMEKRHEDWDLRD